MALPPANTPEPAKTPADKNAAQNEVFLREVDDALRQDQVEGFARRYGLAVVALLVLGLGAFGGWLWWDGAQKQAREERSEQIVLALDDLEVSNFEQANAKLGPVAEAGGTQGAVARILQANAALQQDRTDEAGKLYAAVASDEGVPQQFRDLAKVRGVAARYDTMKPAEVIAELKPLAQPQNPWFGVAGEMLAMAYLEQGKKDEAGSLLVKISEDETVPASLKGRTQQLAATLGYDSMPDIVDAQGEAIVEAKKVGKTTVTKN